MDVTKSVFVKYGYEVVSMSPDGVYHIRYRSPETGALHFDGLGILLFRAHVVEEGFPHPTFEYGENGEHIWGEAPGVEEPWRLAKEIVAVTGNCLIDGEFNYERAERLRFRFSGCVARWLSENPCIEGCHGYHLPFTGNIAEDGLGTVVRDKQVVPREESRVRCFAVFESGDLVFYH